MRRRKWEGYLNVRNLRFTTHYLNQKPGKKRNNVLNLSDRQFKDDQRCLWYKVLSGKTVEELGLVTFCLAPLLSHNGKQKSENQMFLMCMIELGTLSFTTG